MTSLQNGDFQNVKFILMDVEGTTSDIDFVKNVLFPYSARELRNFISTNKNNAAVREALKGVGEKTDEENIEKLLQWIREDLKHPSLKTLQGMIWKKGFEDHTFKSHIYSDVLPAWKMWQAQGMKLGIYSSGSVAAQILYFQHTTEGDLRSYLTAHFDLSTGGKRDAHSYEKIAQALALEPRHILFLSDIEAELDAAREAKFMTAQIVRPGTVASTKHMHFANFAQI